MLQSISQALTELRSAQLDFATPTYCFRSFVKADAFPLFEASQNEHFNRFLSWSKSQSLDDTVLQVKKLLREESLNQSVTFSILAKKSGTWAGFLRWIPYKDGLALSFWLHPNFWGGHASKELLHCIFDIVFKSTALTNLYALIQPENRPSIRLVKNKGMLHVESTQVVHQDGTALLCHVYHADHTILVNPIEMSIF